MLRRCWKGLLAGGLALWVSGCAHVMAYNDAEQQEKQGAHAAAARKAVEAVGHVRDYPEARQLWSRVWPKALAEHLTLAGQAEAAADWATAVRVLEELDALAGQARQLDLPVPMDSLKERITANRHQAAERHYQAGLQAETGGRLKEAAISFRTALGFVPRYKDAEARYEKDRAAAVVRVAVLPFENYSGYPNVAAMLSDKLLSDLLGRQGEFVSYVDRQYLSKVIQEASLQASGLVDQETAVRLGKIAGVRYLVVGKITQAHATTPRNDRLRRDAARVIRDAGGRDVPVSCSYTHHLVTHQAVISASLQIIDVVDGSVHQAVSETEQRADSAEWISDLLGDDRALDFTTKHLQYKTQYAKGHAQLVDDATNALSRRFAGVVSGYLQ